MFSLECSIEYLGMWLEEVTRFATFRFKQHEFYGFFSFHFSLLLSCSLTTMGTTQHQVHFENKLVQRDSLSLFGADDDTESIYPESTAR